MTDDGFPECCYTTVKELKSGNFIPVTAGRLADNSRCFFVIGQEYFDTQPKAERVARYAAENLQIAYFAPGERPQ